MKRTLASLIATSLLATLGSVTTAPAKTLDLAFMPPTIEARNICSPTRDPKQDDLTIGQSNDELTNFQRIRFLRRDITRLQAQDPTKWFDFINALITRRAQVDTEFAGIEELIARITLHIDAHKFEELKSTGLIQRLRQREVEMSSNQRLVLAQYYLNGIGTDPDIDYAKQLITDAAYAGNPNALLSIARFELDGSPVTGWDAPLDLTVTMAFGGLLGRMNENVCGRAERIAREYLNGDVVSRNYDVAYAWYKFSADLGGAEGAWRLVEFHLNAKASTKDNKEMLHYLKLAVERGITVDDTQMAQIKSAGNVSEEELRKILGFNYSEDTGRNRPSISPLLELSVNIDGDKATDFSPYIEYLKELSVMPEAPGWIFTTLGKEVLTRRGRWAGEAEAISFLEIAADRQDAQGMQILAKLLTRYRDDPAQVDRVVGLLTEAVERHGLMSAMDDLDGLYRCKVNDAPRLREADAWRRAYRATEDETFPVSATDLLVLDEYKEPRHIAKVQSQALENRTQSVADFAELVQVDPMAPDSMKRLWAARLDRSDQALEAFAELEFELATNPTERKLAVELFRRIYLNNGVTTALDLAIALVEHNARDQGIADETIELLTKAANRGEGAAIRLLSRVRAQEGRDPIETFQEFEQEIEERGDFLAMMFAIPYLTHDRLDDYIDRAVSEMVCGTKDVDEIGDAYAIWQDAQMSYHWRSIGLHFLHGHVLSKLRISDPQMEQWRKDKAPDERQVMERVLAEGKTDAHRQLFMLTANPDLETYDPDAAAGHLFALLGRGTPGDELWALASYRSADDDLKKAIESRFDVGSLYVRAIENGSVEAKYEYGMVLRDTAREPRDLANSARWLKEAAESGFVKAMTEYGYTLAYGIGVPRNIREATSWLDQASRGGDDRAASLANLIRIGAGQ